MRLNLYEVFFHIEFSYVDKSIPIVRYTRWGRIKKIIKLLKKYSYCNEQALEDFKQWVKCQIATYKDFRDQCMCVGDQYKMYQKKVDLLEKALKEAEK